MSYRRLASKALGTAVAFACGSSSAWATTVDTDGWAEVTQAAHPANYPSVPLPPSVYGAGACVLLVIGLRYSRHRRWVTLRY